MQARHGCGVVITILDITWRLWHKLLRTMNAGTIAGRESGTLVGV